MRIVCTSSIPVVFLPVEIPEIPLSNCCTPLVFPERNAFAVYTELVEKYDIYLTPSGGALKDVQLRVGHLGNLSLEDFDDLIAKMQKVL